MVHWDSNAEALASSSDSVITRFMTHMIALSLTNRNLNLKGRSTSDITRAQKLRLSSGFCTVESSSNRSGPRSQKLYLIATHASKQAVQMRKSSPNLHAGLVDIDLNNARRIKYCTLVHVLQPLPLGVFWIRCGSWQRRRACQKCIDMQGSITRDDQV